MKFYWLVLEILCVWRLTHLLHAEDGPWSLLLRLRRAVGNGFWGGLLDCFYCLSLWIAAPFALLLGQGWRERLLLWLASSGGAILLERSTTRSQAQVSSFYVEDEEGPHVPRPAEAATDSDELNIQQGVSRHRRD
jgi:hypothetical protein